MSPELGMATYCDQLAHALITQAGHQLTLIGFSLGARIALEIAVRLPGQVREVVLISAAGPLECGDFLPHMAGRAVFRTAQRSPRLFQSLTATQSILSRSAPNLLFKALFANAQGADRMLASDAHFRRTVQTMIAASLQSGATGYRREVLAYVAPWADLLPRVRAPVTIWHGTADNWSPPAMADALAARLPHVAAVHKLPGLSHYSTLAAAITTYVQSCNSARTA
jgi:pimeloyl-ACP methyl ester carboxylesterase